MSRLHFTLTRAGEAKFVASAILSTLCLFFLSAARKYNDPNRLFWSLICGLGALACML